MSSQHDDNNKRDNFFFIPFELFAFYFLRVDYIFGFSIIMIVCQFVPFVHALYALSFLFALGLLLTVDCCWAVNNLMIMTFSF